MVTNCLVFQSRWRLCLLGNIQITNEQSCSSLPLCSAIKTLRPLAL